MMMHNGLILITITLLFAISIHGEEEGGHKMRLELVHRHDPRFVRNVDQVEAIKGFIHRDTLRRQRMTTKGPYNKRRKDYETFPQMPMHTGKDYGIGEYFVEVKVGTPRQNFWLAADTGSEFTWFNCVMRRNHHHGVHKQHKGGSRLRNRTRTKRVRSHKKKNNPCNGVFCPHRSRSFETVPCSSQKCKVDLSELFSLTLCPKPLDPCLYDISYADGSSAKGFFGTDTITVDLTNGKKGKLHNLTIGCTRSVQNGVVFTNDTGGILGLGFGKDAFVAKASLEYGAKFSYCLVDHLSHKNVSSYLTFGGHHNVNLLSEMKHTELILSAPYYGVNVVGISVGGQMLKIPPQVWDFNAHGGTIIDSGTTLTSLVIEAYDPVVEALKKSLTNVKRVAIDVLDFCFDAEGFDESVVARLVFHFGGGARFEPPVKSYIIDVAPQVKCIGIVPINAPNGAFSVIGNILQQNHLWEFDLADNTVGFAPSPCT